MKRIYLFYGLLLFIFNSLNAQKITKDSINNLKEVVVSAQYSPQSEKNAIYKVKIINNKTIESKAVNNLTELLRQELNIDFSQNAVFGAGLELNGITKENIKVLIDGVPLIGRVNGVLNLNQINLNNVDHIELIEGPVSVFYGTDALGGIVNIITQKNQKEKVEGSFSAYYETVDAKELNAEIGFVQGKNTFKFGAGYYYFNGLNTNDENVRTLNWPTKRKYYKQFSYLRTLGNYKLVFSSNFSEELLHTLGEIRATKAKDIDYKTQRFDNSLTIQGKLKNHKFIDVTISYLNYDRDDTTYIFKPSDNSVTLLANNPNANANYFDTFFTKLQYAKDDNTKKLNYAVGVELTKDMGEGNRILDYKQSTLNRSVYASLNYKILPNFEIQPAVRYTNNNSFGDLWSPAFNAKYSFNTNNTIRFAYGKGFRAPSLKELYLDWTPQFGPITYLFKGNKDLSLESSNSYHLYYTYRKQLGNSSSLKLEPYIAYNQVNNLIGLSELVTVGSPMDFTKERHYINLNRMKTANIAIQGNYQLNDLKVNVGISYLGRYLEYSDTFDSGGFMFTPAFNSTISYLIKPIGVNFNLFYKYSGKRKGHFIDDSLGDDVLVETTRDAFSNLDASLSTSFFNKKLSFILGAKNIFNVTDIETYNQIGVAHERNSQLWGNSFFIKLNYKFK